MGIYHEYQAETMQLEEFLKYDWESLYFILKDYKEKMATDIITILIIQIESLRDLYVFINNDTLEIDIEVERYGTTMNI